jgi:hypothetical protein
MTGKLEICCLPCQGVGNKTFENNEGMTGGWIFYRAGLCKTCGASAEWNLLPGQNGTRDNFLYVFYISLIIHN